jgi:hypothetical protein
VRLVAWRGCGEGDVVAAIELVEIALVIEDVAIVRRDNRLRVVLPRGMAAVFERDGVALRPVLRWGSTEVARRFAIAVVAAVTARYPLDIAMAMRAHSPDLLARAAR